MDKQVPEFVVKHNFFQVENINSSTEFGFISTHNNARQNLALELEGYDDQFIKSCSTEDHTAQTLEHHGKIKH